MAYPNGDVPASARRQIDAAGRTLLTNTAKAWAWVVSEVERKYGWTPAPSDGWSAYRTVEEQETIFQQNYTPLYSKSAKFDRRVWNGVAYWRKPGRAAAAVPGTSNHGKAQAIDVRELGGFSGTRYKQFATVATKAGFSNTEGRNIDEYWHWYHDAVTVPKPPTPAPKPEEAVPTIKSVSTKNSNQKIATAPAGSEIPWTTLKFSDDGKVASILADPKNSFLTDIKLLLNGVPPGSTIQGRVYWVDTDADGTNSVRRSTYELIERPASPGSTGVDWVQVGGDRTPTEGKGSSRLRVEVRVLLPKGKTATVTVNSARAISQVF